MTDTPFIDLTALRAFLSIAQERNMSTAATRLGITQSAVSQALRGLEDQIGTVLVNRGDRPLSLTPAGALLAEQGAALMEAAIDLKAAVVSVGAGAHPSLRLGLVDSFAAACGTELARECVAWGARLSLRTGLSPDLGRGLLAREFDMVISSESLENADSVDGCELLTEGFVLITPKALTLQVGTVDALKALTGRLPMIRFNRQSHLGSQIDQILRRHGIKAGRTIEVDTSDTLTSMVGGALGWALTTPVCLLQAQHVSQNVDVSVVDTLVGSRSLYLLSLKDQHQQVVEKVRAAAMNLLRGDAMRRLGTIDPRLTDLVRIDPRGAAAAAPT
jgi:DNA-binding transcriptional LysR family regulator